MSEPILGAARTTPLLLPDSPPSIKPGRDGSGRFTPGNRASLKHGRYSTTLKLGRGEVDGAARAARRAALLRELEPDLDTFEVDLVEAYLSFDAVIVLNGKRMSAAPRAADRRVAASAFHEAFAARLRIIDKLSARRRRAASAPADPQAWLESLDESGGDQ